MKFISKFGIVFLLLALLSACGTHFSDGDRVGVITKFSYRGFICPTWEGEMLMGGVAHDGDGNVVANIFQFTVSDPQLVRQIQDALNSGKRTKLHYDQRAFNSPCATDTGYFITAVVPLQ